MGMMGIMGCRLFKLLFGNKLGTKFILLLPKIHFGETEMQFGNNLKFRGGI